MKSEVWSRSVATKLYVLFATTALLLAVGTAAAQNPDGATGGHTGGNLFGGPNRFMFGNTPFGVQQLLLTTTGGPVTLSAISTGWWDELGFHDSSNTNYIAGVCCGGRDHHDFFVFDLSSISSTITAASLNIGNPTTGFSSVNATETYQVFDVSTAVATLTASGSGMVAVYGDLGSGTLYASRSVSPADNGTQVTVPLNAAALAAMNAVSGCALLGGTRTGNVVSCAPFAFGGAILLSAGGCFTHMHGHTFLFGHANPAAHFFGHHTGDPRHGHHFICANHAPGHTPYIGAHLQPEAGEEMANPGFVAGLNQDGSPNGAKAAGRGTVLQLFGSAAGIFLGAEDDEEPAANFTPPASGSPLYATTSLPQVRIGGVAAKVLFSGLAPGLTGVWQINVQIPEEAPAGKTPVTITYEGYELRSVDIAVE